MPKKPKNKPSRSKSKSIPIELFSQYDQLMEFMDNIPDVIYFKDIKGRLTFVNRAYANGLGIEPEKIVGKTDYDIFPKKRARLMDKDDKFVMKTGHPIVDKMERATRADGIDNYVSTTKIPRYDSRGKVIGLMGITRDVTRRLREQVSDSKHVGIEERIAVLDNLNKMKSELISNVSHELRTPLAVIKQLFSLLYNETVGSINLEQRKVLAKAQTHIDYLTRSIEKLFDLSRIEGKKLSLSYSLVNLNNLVKDSKDFFKEMAKKKNIKLKYSIPKQDVNAFIDAERIVEVMANLIGNAIKFTGSNGQIKVEIKVLDNKIRLGVIDSGIGIAKPDIPKVFSRFAQVSPNSSDRLSGIGLGLSIVKEVVERHNGEVWVDSQLGSGSKFYFTLPRFYANDKVVETKIKKKIEGLNKKGLKVHLVNMLIVNYEECRQIIDVRSAKLDKDLKIIINDTLKSFQLSDKNKHEPSLKKGKCSIVFADTADKDILDFTKALKVSIKNYFIKHSINDVFFALGVLLCNPSENKKKGRKSQFESLQEIYVGPEMRRAKRYKYKTEVRIVLPSKRTFICETLDISTVGVCLLSEEAFKTDQKIKMKIHLLRNKKFITIEGRILWISEVKSGDSNKGRYKMGIDFFSVNAKDKNSLSKELSFYYE